LENDPDGDRMLRPEKVLQSVQEKGEALQEMP
jgi:hypothetical protein